VLTRKVLRFLEDMAKNDLEKYKNWFKEFGFFLKEGVCQDYKNQANIAKLLYFESSKSAPGELISLDDYIARCPPEQNEIYYLCAPSRELAEASPYFETFKRNNTEVFFLFNSLDDFVMSNLGKYNGRQLKTAESADLNLDKEQPQSTEQLSAEEAQDLCKWIQQSLDNHVREVKITHRLKDSPAIVTDHASGALRRMLRFVEQQNTGESKPIPKQQFEINPAHPIIRYLNTARKSDEATAKKVAEQVFDNAMIAAGLLDDPRAMLPRLNGIIESLLSSKFGEQH
jgi:HSP90 family molecular chaperone